MNALFVNSLYSYLISRGDGSSSLQNTIVIIIEMCGESVNVRVVLSFFIKMNLLRKIHLIN